MSAMGEGISTTSLTPCPRPDELAGGRQSWEDPPHSLPCLPQGDPVIQATPMMVLQALPWGPQTPSPGSPPSIKFCLV